MERNAEIKSPFTGGKVKEIATTEVKEFRKESYTVHVRYYVCEDTGEQFTTTEQDTLLFNDLYSQYRVKHGIPFPDEIKDIRINYGLNYSQISKILGFGANQYAKYEGGEMPSESNGKMIAAIKNKGVMLSLLENSKSAFNDQEYKRILTAILSSELNRNDSSSLKTIIYSRTNRGLFNGYGERNIDKLFEMVSYIVGEHGEIFPTKLNKIMFYSDFYNYRHTGQSISGLRYTAQNFGPIPDHYATIYDNISTLSKRLVNTHGMIGTLLSGPKVELTYLSETEKKSIDKVIERLKQMTVSEIIEMSHHEQGWQKYYPEHSPIPYDEAFRLQLL